MLNYFSGLLFVQHVQKVAHLGSARAVLCLAITVKFKFVHNLSESLTNTQNFIIPVVHIGR